MKASSRVSPRQAEAYWSGVKDVGAGIKNGFMSAMHGITGGMSTAWDGAEKGGSEMVGGFKQMMSGNILSGLGGMGKGLMSGAVECCKVPVKHWVGSHPEHGKVPRV